MIHSPVLQWTSPQLHAGENKMLSTQENWPKAKIAFAAYFLLALLQWPSSYLIIHVSLSLGVVLNEWVFLAGMSLLIAWKSKSRLSLLFPFRPVKKNNFLLLLVMTFSMVVLVDYLLFLSEKILPPDPAVKATLEQLMTIHSFGDGLWRWFLICLSPAFCEELFFRGFLQNTLAHRWKVNGAMLFAAISFALIHGVPQYLHLYFLLGLYLSWLFKVGGNLWFPMVAHLINNSWTFLTFIFDKKIPTGGIWHSTDSLVMGIAVLVFAIAASRFGREIQMEN